MNWKSWGKKQPMPQLGKYSHICQKADRKTAQSFSHVTWDLNPGPWYINIKYTLWQYGADRARLTNYILHTITVIRLIPNACVCVILTPLSNNWNIYQNKEHNKINMGILQELTLNVRTKSQQWFLMDSETMSKIWNTNIWRRDAWKIQWYVS